jgi:CheY-like chemotaxis protein/nitrogen-specific signal transduction histidine kinase
MNLPNNDDPIALAKTMAPLPPRLGQDATERPNRRNIDFVANISHELRTPMNAVIGMVEVALKEDISRTVRHYLETAKESADVLLRLLNDILDFSKMDAGGFVLECEPLSLRTLLDDTTMAFSGQAYQKGLELACHIPADVPDGLVGDPQRLRQVLANLVGNALKFTNRGEVVIRVTVESYTSEEVCLWFSVSDTGIGISPQDQERIFAPFIQADASTTRLYGGTGLGLAIVSELVSMMGGRLWVESELGVGSSFHFTARFPLQHGLAPSIHDREIPMERLRGVDVLVICSNTTNRRLMEEALVNWGMRPVAVNSGEAALASLTQAGAAGRTFALVIVDPLLDDGDGFALTAVIQQLPGWGGGTILVMSPAERQLLSDRCHGLKIAAQLDKPILQSGLLDAVLTALSDRRSEPTGDGRTRQEPPIAPRSLRILIAEDVPANQEVIKTILTGRGHSVRGVMNGREAVEWFTREAYEVILMDVQMPEVDGLQATRMIRSFEAQTGSHVPILALTAHALNGDRERCLEAGMDDHISKPIDVGEVIRLVERYGTRTEEHSVAAEEAKEQLGKPNERDRLCAEPVFHPQVALARLRGSFRLLQDLARLFFRDSQDLVEQLHRGIAEGNAQEVERAAHSLKGLAANFEAREAVAAARCVEQLGHAGNLAAAPPAADKLEHEIMRLKEALATVCDVSEA